MENPTSDEETGLDSTFIIAIVIGSTGFVLMILGGVYYLSRLGDVPSRRTQTGPAVSSHERKTTKDGQKQQSTTTDDEENNNTVREELIEIYAPAGKLGVILEESTLEGGGPPVVHGIRETSVLRNELLIGDRLIALDDEDVRKMPANKVSKMISKKMENATRKLSIIRTVRGGTGGGPVSSPGVSPAASADRSVGV